MPLVGEGSSSGGLESSLFVVPPPPAPGSPGAGVCPTGVVVGEASPGAGETLALSTVALGEGEGVRPEGVGAGVSAEVELGPGPVVPVGGGAVWPGPGLGVDWEVGFGVTGWGGSVGCETEPEVQSGKRPPVCVRRVTPEPSAFMT